MKNLYRFHIRLIPLIISVFAMGFVANAQALEGDAAAGEKLFKTNCASCHKLDSKLVGPALSGVTERRSLDWLKLWIRDNAALRASGDADAIAIYEEYGGAAMNSFAYLSDEEIVNILTYVENPPVAVATTKETPGPGQPVADEGPSPVWMMVLGGFFLLLIILLVKVRNTLRVVKGDDPVALTTEAAAYMRFLMKNTGFVTLFTIVIGVGFLNETYWYLMGIGVEQDYQPVQPIAFSHKLHAGDNGIDCNYCHSSARHSKTSGIPSANVCMNCHMYVNGSEITDESGNLKYGGERSPEIAKIYAAIGWDPDKGAYIEDYEQKPIKWVRIHNLPDLAYFNHAQHVTAGQVECQTCHGPVETMEEVYQYSSLTMGWCVNCHRETEVKINTNGFYEHQHDALVEKYHGETITVEKIGGLECGKCHY
ncbi:MAG: c-type cytochrome [Bacteroidetes bacterium]|nr:MAG: c-type cytochrome [Bacteroidota bacterium]